MLNQKLQITEKELTMKQENFCREYLICGNASEAYRRAYDYANMKPETIHNKASSFLKQGEIRVRIDQLKSNIEEALGISKITELKILMELRDRCMQRVPVMEFDYVKKEMTQKKETYQDENGEWKEQGIWTFDSAGANSAQDKIFKALGYYATQKQEISGKDGDAIKFEMTQIIIKTE